MAGVNVLHIILYMYIPLVDGKAWGFSVPTSPENYTMLICIYCWKAPDVGMKSRFFFQKEHGRFLLILEEKNKNLEPP